MVTNTEWYTQEYPRIDEYGDMWLDPTGFPGSAMGMCFICRKETLRIDVNFEDYFCNSWECLEHIAKDLMEPDSAWTDSSGTKFSNVHSSAACTPPCVIHSPSDHLMKDWPIIIMRTDSFSYGLIERTCVHGIGHPDPDSVAYFESMGKTSYGVHGCDGCCSGRFEELNG